MKSKCKRFFLHRTTDGRNQDKTDGRMRVKSYFLISAQPAMPSCAPSRVVRELPELYQPYHQHLPQPLQQKEMDRVRVRYNQMAAVQSISLSYPKQLNRMFAFSTLPRRPPKSVSKSSPHPTKSFVTCYNPKKIQN